MNEKARTARYAAFIVAAVFAAQVFSRAGAWLGRILGLPGEGVAPGSAPAPGGEQAAAPCPKPEDRTASDKVTYVGCNGIYD
jgi:hypothetical protein